MAKAGGSLTLAAASAGGLRLEAVVPAKGEA